MKSTKSSHRKTQASAPALHIGQARGRLDPFMQHFARAALVLLLAGSLFSAHASTGSGRETSRIESTGVQAAHTLSMITGVAISPLLGVGAVGAYTWWQAPKEERPNLHWYARPWFWIPALLLVAVVAAKDIIGTATPSALKKPFDAAEAIENKVSGLVAAGAFIPLLITIFPTRGDEASLAAAGFAAIDLGAIGNALLIPFALFAFVIVWLASHAINMLILLSPFTAVDTALKSFRLFVLGLLTGSALLNAWLGAAFALVILLVAFLIAGWSFRLLVFGNVCIWDLLTRKFEHFKPDARSHRLFTARKIGNTPARTFGTLVREDDGTLSLKYRPWLVMPRCTVKLPPGRYLVGRGLFFPEIALEHRDQLRAMLNCPPRYRTHEQELSDALALHGVRDVGVLRGWTALREVFTGGARVAAA